MSRACPRPCSGRPAISSALYDRIGRTYTSTRRSDPRIAAVIRRALGDARSVVNVGAGAGAYEPSDQTVLAVEPAWRMLHQRPAGAAPAVRAAAEALPFPDQAFDAALAVLTLHHWSDWRRGVDEMKRVARRQVLLTFEPQAMDDFWLTAVYFPEIVELDRERCPAVHEIAARLGDCRVEPVPVPHDCADGFLAASWRRPEAYLEATLRAGISAFAMLDPTAVERGVAHLEADLASGEWDRRFGPLRARESLDVCYRLVVTD